MKLILIVALFILISAGLQYTQASNHPVNEWNVLTDIAKDDGVFDGCSFAGMLRARDNTISYNISCGMILKRIDFNAEKMEYRLDWITTR